MKTRDIPSCPAACVTVSKTCLVRHTSMKPAHDAFVFIWSHTLAPWPVNVSVCVSQVCVRFSAPRLWHQVLEWHSPYKCVCVCVSDPSVVCRAEQADSVCVCLQSTQWPLSGLHSALKLSGSVFTAWSTGRYQGLGRENGSPHGRIEWKNIVDELCFTRSHEEGKSGKSNQSNPDYKKYGTLWKT